MSHYKNQTSCFNKKKITNLEHNKQSVLQRLLIPRHPSWKIFSTVQNTLWDTKSTKYRRIARMNIFSGQKLSACALMIGPVYCSPDILGSRAYFAYVICVLFFTKKLQSICIFSFFVVLSFRVSTWRKIFFFLFNIHTESFFLFFLTTWSKKVLPQTSLTVNYHK